MDRTSNAFPFFAETSKTLAIETETDYVFGIANSTIRKDQKQICMIVCIIS